ncbi:carboxypeptidase-like regulatory domain-containing protein [Parabacteroides sp.]
MKNLISLSIVLLIGLSSMICVSCVSNEPEVEIVENPLGEEVYFVVGKVTHQLESLDGVEVSLGDNDVKVSTDSDGYYQLKLNKKGNYPLRFKRDGFVEVATVVSFPQESPNRSSMTVSVDMTRMSEPVTVYPDEEIEIADPTGRAVLHIMRSLAEKTDVSLTVVKDVPSIFRSTSTVEDMQDGSAYAAVLVSPTETELPRVSKLRVNKLTSDSLRLKEMGLYKKSLDGNWVKQENEVVYDESRNAYAVEISMFSTYSMRIPYTIAEGGGEVSDHVNGELTLDNCGNPEAMKGVDLNIKQRCGWEIVSDLDQLITTSLPGVSEKDKAALTTVLIEQLTSIQGSAPGVYDIPVHLSQVSVSGNSVLHYENLAKVARMTCVLDVIYLDQPKSLAVEVVKYTGMQENYTNNSCYQHSGGSGK